MFLTEEEIVDNLISGIYMISTKGKSQIAELKSVPRKDMVKYYRTAGMYIRNEYKLWDIDNPLTQEWRNDRILGNDRYMEDGVDCHPYHPDAISMRILYAIWDKVNND